MQNESCWLTPSEQVVVCEALVNFGLLKWSNNRDLPLKSGGMTDIYINLREARNNPRAIEFISQVFINPLQRLRVDSFVEVPDSVSCFAGPVSIAAGLPYITVREQSKEGRVSKSRVIGNAIPGCKTAILDDVITDGASKVIPYHECVRLGMHIPALVILVDRGQDWKRTFSSEKVKAHVWAGMTLHDVRKFLIMHGFMDRCDTAAEEKNPFIVALDGKSWEDILPIIDQLRTTGCIFKVNDLLFGEGIANLLPNLQVYGRVMADLKCHDIPRTVANTCNRLLACPPWAVTVHGSGGVEMVRAAVKTLKGTPTKVLVVTVLTSIDSKTCEEIYTRLPWEQVKVLAKIAKDAGAHGLVCSPEEVRELRKLCPRMTFVVPGVRSKGAKKDDQKRTGTPRGALGDGANHIVMGSQIFNAVDPVAEVNRLLTKELATHCIP